MPTNLHLHENCQEVCIKARSPPASLAFMGPQVTKHSTVKWLIGQSEHMLHWLQEQAIIIIDYNNKYMSITVSMIALPWQLLLKSAEQLVLFLQQVLVEQFGVRLGFFLRIQLQKPHWLQISVKYLQNVEYFRVVVTNQSGSVPLNLEQKNNETVKATTLSSNGDKVGEVKRGQALTAI